MTTGLDTNTQKYDKIRVYQHVAELTGHGEEWLVTSTGDILMIFVDGMFHTPGQSALPQGNCELTKICGSGVA
jgi:hypothetical protein